ncbi:MAG: hypothetical protein R3B13_20745 [Polyangiaceae bacterium]
MRQYWVFAQRPPAALPLAELVNSARSHFRASLEVTSETGLDAQRRGDTSVVTLRLRHDGLGVDDVLTVRTRASQADDLVLARAAELQGKAAGMAALAERCPSVWVVDAPASLSDVAKEAASLLLCAVLASVGLGPVLPPDRATLFGVRGARERADKLLGAPALQR